MNLTKYGETNGLAHLDMASVGEVNLGKQVGGSVCIITSKCLYTMNVQSVLFFDVIAVSNGLRPKF